MSGAAGLHQLGRAASRLAPGLALFALLGATVLCARGCDPWQTPEGALVALDGPMADAASDVPSRACLVRANGVQCFPSLAECQGARVLCAPFECSPCCAGDCVVGQ